MNVSILDTPEKQAKGLQHLQAVPRDTIFVFPLVTEEMFFHSRNVPERFDIAFLDEDFVILEMATITPPDETIDPPAGTAMAIESAAGKFKQMGFAVGNRVTF